MYLAELEYQIEEWIGKRQHGELAMLDLAMAYDTAERIPILHNLHRWGIRPDGSVHRRLPRRPDIPGGHWQLVVNPPDHGEGGPTGHDIGRSWSG